MVAETCSGNWIKDAMVCSSKCRFGRFFREEFSCIKKTIFFYNFSLILGVCIPVPRLCVLYIFEDPCQVSKMFLKKLEFLDDSPQSNHMYIVCIVI